MKALVQYSTGAGSAEVAVRAIERHGVENVVLITADTAVEDEDNWRFAEEAWRWMGEPEWVRLKDGRSPMQVGMDLRVVPNNRMAVCSRVLKREIIRRHLDANYHPDGWVIYLGFDWTEEHRLQQSVEPWKPWVIAAPLMDAPYVDKATILDAWRSRGVQPPRLYDAGFAHANCGGCCVRSGQAQWALVLKHYPERYRQWENDEEDIRGMLGKDVAILRDRRGGETKPLTLVAFRERLMTENPEAYDHEDWGACGCTVDDVTFDENHNQGQRPEGARDMSDTEQDDFELELVDEIPASKRGSNAGIERDTKIKKFYAALTAKPVGTKAVYARGVRSPSYGGDQAAERYPALKMSARQTGSTRATGRDGVEKDVPLYDLFGEHIDPATRPPKRVRKAKSEVQADPPADGLLS